MLNLKNTVLGITTLFTMNALTSCSHIEHKADVLGVTYKANKKSAWSARPTADTLILSVDTGNHVAYADTLLLKHNQQEQAYEERFHYMGLCKDARGEQKHPRLLVNHTVYSFKNDADYMGLKDSVQKAHLVYGIHSEPRFRIEPTANIR